jgi:hypothetical protein
MRTYKYYGWHPCFVPNEEFRKKYPTNHMQFRIVVKAKSLAECNRILDSMGVSKFTYDACETGNQTEIEMCDKYGAIICTQGSSGNKFVNLKEAAIK